MQEITYGLIIACLTQETKQQVMDWFIANDISSFVEGTLDNLDAHPDYENIEKDMFDHLGGQTSSIEFYSFDQQYIKTLKTNLEQDFTNKIECKITQMSTKSWQEGWKDNFKPFTTESFRICPPWEKDTASNNKIQVVIEPGMAFGTGDHATTKLCLLELERQAQKPEFSLKNSSICDVGTGSGILAICSRLILPQSQVDACDIDPDSIKAFKENCKRNETENIAIWQGTLIDNSSPRPPKKYKLIFANILQHILISMLDDLVSSLCDDGSIVFSGILSEHQGEMITAAAKHGLRLEHSSELEGWVCLNMKKTK